MLSLSNNKINILRMSYFRTLLRMFTNQILRFSLLSQYPENQPLFEFKCSDFALQVSIFLSFFYCSELPFNVFFSPKLKFPLMLITIIQVLSKNFNLKTRPQMFNQMPHYGIQVQMYNYVHIAKLGQRFLLYWGKMSKLLWWKRTAMSYDAKAWNSLLFRLNINFPYFQFCYTASVCRITKSTSCRFLNFLETESRFYTKTFRKNAQI